MKNIHPGQILFINETNQTERTRLITEVPEAIAWVRSNAENHPVIKVITNIIKNQRIICSYGVNGELLSRTVQRKL